MAEEVGKKPGMIYAETEFLKSAKVGIRILNKKDLDILYVNKMMEDMFGYKKDELIGKPLSVLYSDADGDPGIRIEGIKKALSEKGEWHGEIRHVRKDGTTLWGYATTLTINYSGFGECYLTIENDISETKKLEEELGRSREQYRVVVDNLNDVVWDFNPETNKYNYVSPSSSNLLGYEPEEMKEMSIFSILKEESLVYANERFYQRLNSFLKEEGIPAYYYDQVDLKRKDGSILHAEVKTRFVKDSVGKIKFVGITRDITNEMELLKKLEFLKLAIDNASEAIFLLDNDARFTYVNPAFEQTTGYTFDEAIGKDTSIIRDIFQDQLVYEGIWTALKRENVWKGPLVNRKKDGSLYYYKWSHFLGQGTGLYKWETAR